MALNRNATGVMVLALLAISGLGLTAATIDTTFSSDVPGIGPGDSAGTPQPGADDDRFDSNVDDQDMGTGDEGSQTPFQLPRYCIEFFTTPLGILALIGGIGLAIALTFRVAGFIHAAFVGYLLGLPALIGYGLVTQCPQTGAGGGSQSALAAILENPAVGGALTTTPVPPALLIGIFIAAALAAGVALVFGSGDEDIEPPSTEDEDETDLEELAAAAGEAATLIESADASVDNAVYRAWLEMTTLLDIPNPETSTPGEFAEAAVEEGLERDDVDQLTLLFEEVRYGDMDPEPREELAIETLRGIEERYGGTPDTDDESGEEET